MRAVDTNILVYADREQMPEHEKAARVLRELAAGAAPWILPWPCVYEFLRVVTHPRIFRPPTPALEAWKNMEALFDSPACVVVSEGERHRKILGELLLTIELTGNVLHDAHIAALLIENGVDEIITADEDFRRFPQLKVTNPFRA